MEAQFSFSFSLSGSLAHHSQGVHAQGGAGMQVSGCMQAAASVSIRKCCCLDGNDPAHVLGKVCKPRAVDGYSTCHEKKSKLKAMSIFLGPLQVSHGSFLLEFLLSVHL